MENQMEQHIYSKICQCIMCKNIREGDCDEEEEDDNAMQCYSAKNIHRREYSIGSGNYIIVDFDDWGEQCAVYKSSDYGKINTLVNELLVITHNKHGEQLIKLVSEDYDLNDEKDESYAIYPHYEKLIR
tara:strand:+ start:4738 stop:5124 length:387 start_codon:yes stop_codon:yes gene_type:complete